MYFWMLSVWTRAPVAEQALDLQALQAVLGKKY
jgi:hypothetical protein